MKQILAGLLALAVMMGSSAAYAVHPDEIMSDPAKEPRARDLSRELRCMVCQNQSIGDSDAPLARDLRLLVRASGSRPATATPRWSSFWRREAACFAMRGDKA